VSRRALACGSTFAARLSRERNGLEVRTIVAAKGLMDRHGYWQRICDEKGYDHQKIQNSYQFHREH